jgi:hypothetical protein
VARALSEAGIDDRAAVPVLTKAVADKQIGVHYQALVALYRVWPDGSARLPAIIPLFKDKEALIRTCASTAQPERGRPEKGLRSPEQTWPQCQRGRASDQYHLLFLMSTLNQDPILIESNRDGRR